MFTKAAPFFVAVLLAAGPVSRVGGQAPPMWGDIEPGAHPVGLRVAWVADSARPFGSQSWRPIRVMIWYPATSVQSGSALKISDLLILDAPDTSFADYARAMRTRDSSTTSRQFAEPADSLTDWITGLTLTARLNAPPAAGRHPLVLYSLGLNDYQLESTVLWEYLASRGYVVVVVPQLGPAPDRASLRLTLADLCIQQADLQAGWRLARTFPFIDGDAVVVVGHSAGALAGFLLADAMPGIRGLVSLEGSVASPDGVDLMLEAGLPDSGFAVPMLVLHVVGQGRGDFRALDRSRNRQYRIGFGTGRPPALATHFDFQNWPIFGDLLGMEDARGVTARPGALGAAIYRSAIRLTGLFIDQVLRGSADADDMLSGRLQAPWLPAGMVQFSPREVR